MTARPAIKGAAIATLVEDVRGLLEGQPADRERLEAQLGRETLLLLERKVNIASWYPIECYNELTGVLWREQGASRPDYLRQRGERLIARLMEAGLYQQFTFMQRANETRRERVPRADILHSARLIGSVTGAIRNFGRDEFEWDSEHSEHLLHHIHEVRHLSEAMQLVGEGSLTYILHLLKPDAPPVRSRRLAPDHIVYRADYSGVLAD